MIQDQSEIDDEINNLTNKIMIQMQKEEEIENEMIQKQKEEEEQMQLIVKQKEEEKQRKLIQKWEEEEKILAQQQKEEEEEQKLIQEEKEKELAQQPKIHRYSQIPIIYPIKNQEKSISNQNELNNDEQKTPDTEEKPNNKEKLNNEENSNNKENHDTEEKTNNEENPNNEEKINNGEKPNIEEKPNDEEKSDTCELQQENKNEDDLYQENEEEDQNMSQNSSNENDDNEIKGENDENEQNFPDMKTKTTKKSQIEFKNSFLLLATLVFYFVLLFAALSLTPIENERNYLIKCPQNAHCDINKIEQNKTKFTINHCEENYAKLEDGFIQICSPKDQEEHEKYWETLKAASYISKNSGNCLFNNKIDLFNLLDLFPEVDVDLLRTDEDFLTEFVNDEFKSVSPQYNWMCRIYKNAFGKMNFIAKLIIISIIVILLSLFVYCFSNEGSEIREFFNIVPNILRNN